MIFVFLRAKALSEADIMHLLRNLEEKDIRKI